ncbi:MAG: hypothetical protein ACI87O_002059 [Planctomycetota bacterium]|jgi:hypothetical protein
MTPHNDSKSQTQLTLTSTGLHLRSRVQSLSLIEELPGLDLDGDGLLSAFECKSGASRVVDCLAEGYRFGSEAVSPVQAKVVAVELLPRDLDGFGMPKLQELRVDWQAQLPEGLIDVSPLQLGNELFRSSSPGHQDLLTYRFDSEAPTVQMWTAGGATHALIRAGSEPPRLWQDMGCTVWQGGTGLALVLALACWRGTKSPEGTARGPSWAWLSLLASTLCTSMLLSFVGRPDSGAAWFLPVALIYVLVDSRLGGGLLRSRFALALWGGCFAAGAWTLPRGIPNLGPMEGGLILAFACSLCFVLAIPVRSMGQSWPVTRLPRLALIAAIAVCLYRVKSTFT